MSINDDIDVIRGQLVQQKLTNPFGFGDIFMTLVALRDTISAFCTKDENEQLDRLESKAQQEISKLNSGRRSQAVESIRDYERALRSVSDKKIGERSNTNRHEVH